MTTLKFSSFGAYITSWQIDGHEVLYQGSELKRTGIPLLFPNFDAGDQLPYHGFGRISQWQIIRQSLNKFHLRLTDTDISPDFKAVYPYQFVVDLEVAAVKNYLNYQLTVHNLTDKPMPVAPGLHPYWPIKHSQKSHIVTSGFQINDWDASPPNELHSFSGEFTAQFPDYRLTIKEIGSRHYFQGLQVWSQNQSFPDFDYVCFEPVTRPPQGINVDPILIAPLKKLALSLRFIYQPT